MTTPTHSLCGAFIGLALSTGLDSVEPIVGSRLTWCVLCILLSNAPDIDLVFGLLPASWTAGRWMLTHRGVTHSLLFCALCAVPAVWLSGAELHTSVGLLRWALFSAVAWLHLLCDMVDGSIGVRLWAPFSGQLTAFPFKLSVDVGLDAFGTAAGRKAFVQVLLIETLFVTAPLSGICLGVAGLVR